MTNTEKRRVGKYHHGEETIVVATRIPKAMRDALKANAEKAGMTMAERIEWLIETQLLRDR